MLYLKTSVKNGIISLHPLNPDEMYYKCEVWLLNSRDNWIGTITSTPCSNAGCFPVHRKFTEQNRAGIEFINQMAYNVVNEVRFRHGG